MRPCAASSINGASHQGHAIWATCSRHCHPAAASAAACSRLCALCSLMRPLPSVPPAAASKGHGRGACHLCRLDPPLLPWPACFDQLPLTGLMWTGLTFLTAECTREEMSVGKWQPTVGHTPWRPLEGSDAGGGSLRCDGGEVCSGVGWEGGSGTSGRVGVRERYWPIRRAQVDRMERWGQKMERGGGGGAAVPVEMESMPTEVYAGPASRDRLVAQ